MLAGIRESLIITALYDQPTFCALSRHGSPSHALRERPCWLADVFIAFRSEFSSAEQRLLAAANAYEKSGYGQYPLRSTTRRAKAGKVVGALASRRIGFSGISLSRSAL
jgi:hypothetical protein